MPNGYRITEEERDTLVYPRLECMDAQELLDVWLLPLVLEVGTPASADDRHYRVASGARMGSVQHVVGQRVQSFRRRRRRQE